MGQTPSTAQPNTPTAQIRQNNFKSTGNLKLTLANDGSGNVLTNVLVFQGLVPGNAKIAANKPDGTHTTIVSAQLSGTVAEVLDYLKNVKGHVLKMSINTSDTDNWNGGNGLVLGRVGFDGRTEEMEINFDDYKQRNGSDLNDTLTIDDVDFLIGGNFYMYVRAIKTSTSMTFTITVDSTNDGALLTKRS